MIEIADRVYNFKLPGLLPNGQPAEVSLEDFKKIF